MGGGEGAVVVVGGMRGVRASGGHGPVEHGVLEGAEAGGSGGVGFGGF